MCKSNNNTMKNIKEITIVLFAVIGFISINWFYLKNISFISIRALMFGLFKILLMMVENINAITGEVREIKLGGLIDLKVIE